MSRADPPCSGASLQAWLHWQEQLHPREIDLGLERVRAVAEKLGLFPWNIPTVTVAGTNGKGSSVAFLEAGLRASGLRTLAYTSPHLLRYNERVRVDGHMASDAQLVRAFEQIERVRGDISLSYFEYGTLAALWLARAQAVEICLLEVGLGGRLDAVNIVDADVALITRIGLDHTDWLGDDREQIGREKAGILRADRPAVCSDPEPPASIAQTAQALPTRLWQLGVDFSMALQDTGLLWQCGDQRLRLPELHMQGPWQLDNLAGALMALKLLQERISRSLNWQVLSQAVAQVQLPGRLMPWPEDARVWMDVGHNPAALSALQPWLRQKAPLHVVFAALKDKDIAAMVQQLRPHVAHWWLAGLDVPRGLQAAELAQIAAVQPASMCETPRQALQQARQLAGPETPILVCGSFHTVAQAWGDPSVGKSG